MKIANRPNIRSAACPGAYATMTDRYGAIPRFVNPRNK